MTDPSELKGTSNDATQPAQETSDTPVFRIGSVLKVVMPLVLLGAAGIAFVGFFDGLTWLSSLLDPPLVTATGQVMYQGEPLESAQISTRHANGKMAGSIGWTDAQGRFSLKTDIDGYVDGAYGGEHQVVVTLPDLENAPMVGAPSLLTPEKYASFATTPLRITVSRAAEENEYLFTLEGNPPARPAAGGGGNRQAAGGEFDPEAIVARVFETYDKDDDHQLTADEMQAIEGNRVERIRQADANQDGVIKRDELLQAFSPAPQSE